jgi:hypothetical protein
MQGLHSESLGRVACVVHLELLGLCLCVSTIATGTINCNEPKNNPPKQSIYTATIFTRVMFRPKCFFSRQKSRRCLPAAGEVHQRRRRQ